MSSTPSDDPPHAMGRNLALGAVAVCALIWGTTWYAITFQLGVVDPLVSVVWRFAIAAGVLFLVCLVIRRPIRLTRSQHLAALGQGGLAFALSYACVYAAEEKITSGVVAVAFASMALMNLVLFRVVVGQKAAGRVWLGAALGAGGVLVLTGGELLGARLGPDASTGVALALLASVASTVGNYFAWRGQSLGAMVLPSTAWAMAYGSLLLTIVGLATGVEWRFDLSLTYVGSLLYLAIFGSVIAFVLYFSLARSRGFTLASYIGALTPIIAMTVSVLFENARFGWPALVGLALVVLGQFLIVRAPKSG
ncbi:DMT family transporter [Brevundimonas sp. VNH65]|uniref:DMT family transporter n=1 Tax=Brevundimonas sp. VNH65 TaxID=3400917 RepID=UPI003C0B0DC5